MRTTVEHNDQSAALRGEVVRYYDLLFRATDEDVFYYLAQVKPDSNLDEECVDCSGVHAATPPRYEFLFDCRSYRRLGQLTVRSLAYEKQVHGTSGVAQLYRLGRLFSLGKRRGHVFAQKSRTLRRRDRRAGSIVSSPSRGRLREP